MTRYIQRHSLLTRVTHGVVAITCILLAVTGLFVFWPELGGSVMGGEFTHWMRMLHRIFAIPFILIPLYAVFRSPKGCEHLFKEDIFQQTPNSDNSNLHPCFVWVNTLFTEPLLKLLTLPEETGIRQEFVYLESLHGTFITCATGLRAPPSVLA